MQRTELQSLLDYVAIRQLNAKYNRYADLADGTSYSNLSTEDAELNIVGEGTYVGREQVAARCNATTTPLRRRYTSPPNQNWISAEIPLSNVFACSLFSRTEKELAMNLLPQAGISMSVSELRVAGAIIVVG